MATEVKSWSISVCPACGEHRPFSAMDLVHGGQPVCSCTQRMGENEAGVWCLIGEPTPLEGVEVVPRSEVDELHRELGLIKSLGAEVDRLRVALQDALTGCEVAANMSCTCTGYYRCNSCVNEVAEQAEMTADVIREALGMTNPAGSDPAKSGGPADADRNRDPDRSTE